MKNYLTSKTITKEIDGEEVEFRRIPVGLLQECRHLNESVSKAIAMLLKDTSKDIEVEQVSVPSGEVDKEGNAIMTTQYKQSAVQPSIASMRALQVEQGTKGILTALTCEESLKLASRIIVASAHKTFTKEDVDAIKENMDLVTMGQFLMGAFEASAGDFSKLGKSLFQKNSKIQELMDQVKDQI